MKLEYKVWMLILITLVLAGCGNVEADQAAPTDEEAVSVDNYDRKVTVPEPPQSVLTFGPNTTELLIALGLGDRIIGNSLDNHSRGPLPQYEEAYNKVPELTYGPATREAVIASGADFIYGIGWEFGESGLDVTELEQYVMQTYMNKASTLEETYTEIRGLGKIFDVEEKAKAFITEQQERIADVEKRVADNEPVDVLVYDSGGEGVFTAGGPNFETRLIEKAGGRNIFDDITDKQWMTVGYEEILERDPDVIVIHDYDAPSVDNKIRDLKNHPILSELEAVKNDCFVTISLESVLPGNRMAYTVEKFAEGFQDL
ncbi:ABC transporter substrate-binding protein [Salimicrobium flavidum]|uniref:Iron complex transport system substrate-binding protein n=1 Tax=Salimicrobium flavidum TaxID=570947 RepID=A0A1N7JAF3_9BACI|nr:ABC transporter substrate-binding protein [Salimicrobium flavidum]SIS46231.1 iron complex transport system substrate-binding protein [Salimicrobium flavidum]